MSETKPVRVLHFADAHIDIANYGRHDPDSALPVRVMDFLHALDQIVDTAVSEKVDLVIFAGDAYKDRNPQPTFQRAWGERMMRLSAAGIPTLLLVGNHDMAPATGRAHTLQEFKTLQVPHIHVADNLQLWTAEELGAPVQVISVPWLSRSRMVNSRMMAREDTAGMDMAEIYTRIEEVLSEMVLRRIEQADPALPLILTAHASIQGAKYGSERTVMLGQELILSGRLVRDGRLDYVALGHIHRPQSLNDGAHPPIVYPGSIERIDFSEKERRRFVIASVARGKTEWDYLPLQTRRFSDTGLISPEADRFMPSILQRLPDADEVAGAICRLRLQYPRDQEPLLDENEIYQHYDAAFSIQIQKHYLQENRARLSSEAGTEEMTPEHLLDTYWRTIGLEADEIAPLQELAAEIINADTMGADA